MRRWDRWTSRGRGSVGEVFAVAGAVSVAKCARGEVAFNAGALGAVGIEEVPAPCAADETQRAGCLEDLEVGFDFDGLDEADEVSWEFGGDGADGCPDVLIFD